MAPEQKKRSRPVPANSQRSKKRQRVEDAAGKAAKAPPKKVKVIADALPWNEVEMPEMFDDAEGFFGLEEIDDVEVIREGGNVHFLSAKAQQADDDEEFEGFGDDEAPAEAAVASPEESAPVITKSAEPKEDKKGKKEILKKETEKNTKKNGKLASKDEIKSTDATVQNVFDLLEDEAAEEEVDMSSWADVDLSSECLMTLGKMKFSKPTPIQAAAIPEIIAGHDVIGKASTGSGKTLAFGIPILERWLDDFRSRDPNAEVQENQEKIPTALILSPTRELAHQIGDHIRKLCLGLTDAPYTAVVTGGLSAIKQQRQLDKADIIIGTPGRLWEVISTSVKLSKTIKQIKFLVIDEADRLLSEGHFKEAEEIITALDRQVDGDEDYVPARQTLVFSATFHKGLQQKLAGKGRQGLLDNAESMEYLLKKLNFREEKPKFIDANPVSQMAEGLKEGLIECDAMEKDLYLYSVLLYHPNQRTLVFTNSIHSVRRLVPLLQNLNLPALALHSSMPQKARLRSIERFSAPDATSAILVATDVAARGLDIKNVQLVIHYHLPRSADMYVHRSGRTARASTTGSSILICAPEEVVPTRRLVAKVHVSNAAKSAADGAKGKYYMRSLDIDRKIVARLKARVSLAKRIADATLAKEKGSKEEDWLKNAAEELGVDYDEDEFDALERGKGRGTARKLKVKEAMGMSKGEVQALRAQLRELLSQRVNVGVSERYLTSSGDVNMEELLKGVDGNFLGKVGGIGMDD